MLQYFMGSNHLRWLLIGFYTKKKRKFQFIQAAMETNWSEKVDLKECIEKCPLNLVDCSKDEAEMVFLNDDKSVSRKLLAPVVVRFFEK